MKKTLLIVALSFVTQLGFSQTNQSGDREESVSAKPVDETADRATIDGNSKQATLQIVNALLSSHFKKLDTNMLKSTITMINEGRRRNEIYNSLRYVITSIPAEAYKSGSLDAAKKVADIIKDDMDFKAYNSILLKWEMLLTPAALGDKWPTMETNWKNSLQFIK